MIQALLIAALFLGAAAVLRWLSPAFIDAGLAHRVFGVSGCQLQRRRILPDIDPGTLEIRALAKTDSIAGGASPLPSMLEKLFHVPRALQVRISDVNTTRKI